MTGSVTGAGRHMFKDKYGQATRASQNWTFGEDICSQSLRILKSIRSTRQVLKSLSLQPTKLLSCLSVAVVVVVVVVIVVAVGNVVKDVANIVDVVVNIVVVSMVTRGGVDDYHLKPSSINDSSLVCLSSAWRIN